MTFITAGAPNIGIILGAEATAVELRRINSPCTPVPMFTAPASAAEEAAVGDGVTTAAKVSGIACSTRPRHLKDQDGMADGDRDAESSSP